MMKLVLLFVVSLGINGGLIAQIVESDSISAPRGNEKDELREIEGELKFYFEEIGGLDADGDYRITDWHQLLTRIKAGDETAKRVYEIYTAINTDLSISSPKDFAICVVGKFRESYGSIARAFLTGAIYTYIAKKQWDLAARLMFNTLKAAGFKTNAASLAIEAGIYGFQCRKKW